MAQQFFAPVAKGISIFRNAVMGQYLTTEVTPVILVHILTIVREDVLTPVAEGVIVHGNTSVGQHQIAQIAPIVVVFVYAVVEDPIIANITPVIQILIGALVICKIKA